MRHFGARGGVLPRMSEERIELPLKSQLLAMPSTPDAQEIERIDLDTRDAGF
jgi:hypothetical protein